MDEGNGVSARQTIRVSVKPALAADVRVPLIVVTAGRDMTAEQPVVATGGLGALTYAVSPKLPRGLVFDRATGRVSGKPRSGSAEADYRVTVRDAHGSSAEAAFRLAVNAAVVATREITTVKIVVGTDVSATPVSATGGTGGLTFAIEPALPDGLTYDTTDGTMSGVLPGFVEPVRYRVTVTDALGSKDVAAFHIAASKAAQTIDFAPIADAVLTDGTSALAATASSGLPVVLASTTPAVCTVEGTTARLLTVGTCRIRAEQAGNEVYAAARAVAQAFRIKAAPKKEQTIAFPAIADRTLGSGDVSLDATATSGLAVTYGTTTPQVCSVSGTTASLLAVGICSITADQAGDDTWLAAATVTQSFKVEATPKKEQTIDFQAIADRTLGSGDVTLDATATSGLAVTYGTTTPQVCSVSGSTASLLAVGTCSITADQAGDDTWLAAATVTQSFKVEATPKKEQTIDFPAIADRTLGSGDVSLDATASSGLAVTFGTTTPQVCSVSGSTASLIAVGTCSITADQAGDDTWLAASTVTQSFKVEAAPKKEQTIAFPAIADRTLGSGDVSLDATASSGLGVTFGTTTPQVCSVSGSTASLIAVGTCSITADQAGDDTWLAAATVTQSFKVEAAPKQEQTIAFPAIADRTLGSGDVTLDATATSGLAVTYGTTTPQVCSVSGSTASLIAVGTCSITADQAGDDTWLAAATVTQSFKVEATRRRNRPSTSRPSPTAPSGPGT